MSALVCLLVGLIGSCRVLSYQDWEANRRASGPGAAAALIQLDQSMVVPVEDSVSSAIRMVADTAAADRGLPLARQQLVLSGARHGPRSRHQGRAKLLARQRQSEEATELRRQFAGQRSRFGTDRPVVLRPLPGSVRLPSPAYQEEMRIKQQCHPAAAAADALLLETAPTGVQIGSPAGILPTEIPSA